MSTIEAVVKASDEMQAAFDVFAAKSTQFSKAMDDMGVIDAPSEITSGNLLIMLRKVLDAKDALTEEGKTAAKMESVITEAVIAKAKAEGTDKFSSPVLSVTLGKQTVAKYDPALWPVIHKKLVDDGHEYVLHRRLSAGKLQELFDSGYCLPAGLTLEELDKLSARRPSTRGPRVRRSTPGGEGLPDLGPSPFDAAPTVTGRPLTADDIDF